MEPIGDRLSVAVAQLRCQLQVKCGQKRTKR
jgi:hypothetical protein